MAPCRRSWPRAGRQRNPPIFACSLCHYPNGKGRPENAPVAGLPYDYIVQQLKDFKAGLRKTSDPRKGNTGAMANFAKGMTDEEIKQAATYFSSIPLTPWVKVVESATAPKARPQAGLFLPLEGAEAGIEPIGERIMEVPEDTRAVRIPAQLAFGLPRLCAARQPARRAKTWSMNGVTGSGEKVTACTVCHGSDLRGIGQAPPLAGRSPSYIARQLYDMQHGNRSGPWALLMAPGSRQAQRRRSADVCRLHRLAAAVRHGRSRT